MSIVLSHGDTEAQRKATEIRLKSAAWQLGRAPIEAVIGHASVFPAKVCGGHPEEIQSF